MLFFDSTADQIHRQMYIAATLAAASVLTVAVAAKNVSVNIAVRLIVYSGTLNLLSLTGLLGLFRYTYHDLE